MTAVPSRVEVSFHDEGRGRTRVELVRSPHPDRHGPGWEIRENVGSSGGWGRIMDRFAKSAAA